MANSVALKSAPEAEDRQTVEPTAEKAVQGGGKGKKVIRLLLLIGALATAGWLAHAWWYGLSHVTSENAEVQGHIVPVLAKVGGYVTAVNVHDNQQVKAGETLVRIDDRDYNARLKQARGTLAALQAQVGTEGHTGQAVAQVNSARAQAASAQARVAVAEANADKARRELKRLQEMADAHYVSQQQLDGAQAAAKAAAADVIASKQAARAANDQIAVAQAGLRAADGQLQAAQATVDQASIQLDDTRLTAPAGGVISKKNVEVGQLVQPGQPLMSVVPMDDVWVVANLKETEIRDVNPGDKVDFSVDAYPGVHFQGTVESLAAATGSQFSLLPPDNATGNFTKVVQRIPVKILVDGGQNAKYPLRPGMSAVVDIVTRKDG